jgi:hypothetical protein
MELAAGSQEGLCSVKMCRDKGESNRGYNRVLAGPVSLTHQWWQQGHWKGGNQSTQKRNLFLCQFVYHDSRLQLGWTQAAESISNRH